MKILDSRLFKVILIIIVAIALNICVFLGVNINPSFDLVLEYHLVAEQADTFQVFYGQDDKWNEQCSTKIDYIQANAEQKLIFTMPKDSNEIRIDLGNQKQDILLSNISIQYLWNTIDISNKVLNDEVIYNDIYSIRKVEDNIEITTNGSDPYISMSIKDLNLHRVYQIEENIYTIIKVMICLVIDILLLIFIKKRKTVIVLKNEVLNNKKIIINLAVNDFKTKFAGSYLGIIWAFIQPVVTVLVYWFVFQVGFKSAPVEDFPFVLWLIAGIVPWFFFSEALMNATNSMIEYNYLVKKVVFKISILPIVKIISALFVHIFFIMFTFILFILYGYKLDVYILQVFYYTLCMIMLVLGISYATSAIVIFFKDLVQIINILLQIGMWLTPIMWSYTMLGEGSRWILKLNPMYYIVEGYRDALINKVWFWEHLGQTIYFWIIAIGIFGIGTAIFKKLKIHFADVL